MRDRLKRQGLFNKFGGDLLYLSLPALLATLVDEEDQVGTGGRRSDVTASGQQQRWWCHR